jgi:GR25 family glycosyltransferase involved in LPS biosynthesis
MSVARSFSRIVCINLDRRPDRWRRVQTRFALHGIEPVERFSAVDGLRVRVPEIWNGREGAYGCLRSHLDVIAEARDHRVEDILIFEDDVEFAPDLDDKFARAITQLPNDWDILYFGGIQANPPKAVGDSLARVSRTLSTFAYAIRARAFDVILDEIDPSIPVPVDDQLTGIQNRLACYCIFPHAAWVECDYSDIQDREDNHWYIRQSVVLGNHCLDDMVDSIALVIPTRAPGWRRAGVLQIEFLLDHLSPHLRGLSVILDESSSPWEPSRLAAHAFEKLDANVKFVLVAGSPVFLPQRHVIAALQMSRVYDVVIPFQESVALSPEAVNDILSGRWLTVDPARYPRTGLGGRELGWGFFSRRSPTAGNAIGPPTVFQVPTVALCLDRGEPHASDSFSVSIDSFGYSSERRAT